MRVNPSTSLLLAAFVLGGCVFTHIEEGIVALRGRDISTAFQVLGYPNGEQTIYGKKVYIWSTSNSVVIPTEKTSYGNGYIGNTRFNYQETTYQNQMLNGFCTIRIFTDGVFILGGDFSGNNGGCLSYSMRLSEFASQAEEERRSMDKIRKETASIKIEKTNKVQDVILKKCTYKYVDGTSNFFNCPISSPDILCESFETGAQSFDECQQNPR